MDPARRLEEQPAERPYDKFRIYHRYTVLGFREKLVTGSLHTIRQEVMKFTPYEEQVAFIESLFSDEQQPPREVWVRKFQRLIDEDASQVESNIRIAASQRHPGFTEYAAEHEERVKGTFHVLNATVKDPIQVFRFGVYNSQVGNPDTFLLAARVDITDSFLKRFIHQGVITLYTPIDLEKLAAAGTTKVRGAGFHISGRPTLRTATIFGPEVNLSDMWANLSSDGTLQFVQLQIVTGNREVTLRVSSRGSLMPFGIEDTGEQLALVTDVYDTYLRQFEKPAVILR